MSHCRQGRQPQRTCVGCRKTSNRSDLLRLTYDCDRQQILADPKRKAGGRGAWVHHTGECLQRALRPGVLAGALRLPAQTPVAAEGIETAVAQATTSSA
ncbi:MAG: YlxR family protein [Actinomycetaceae bacterium]|nr:YlxR family protein [Actinomycetaceae bacterium]